MSETSHAERVRGRSGETLDNPLARLRLLAGDDEAIASFLDELDVSSPRERECSPSSPGRVRSRDRTGSTPTTVG